jgi:DNA-binding transcriptional ArsR family regulator
MESTKWRGNRKMTHYRQIIVNIAVEDDTRAEVLEELVQHVQMCMEEHSADLDEVREIEVKLN